MAGLAIIGAALANRGTLQETQVLSEEGWAALHSHATAEEHERVTQL